MERKIEREWKSIACPDGKYKSMVMCEWEMLSEEGRILKKTLKQIDCRNPKLTELGGRDCNWTCEKAIAKEEITRSGMEWLWVCFILVAGILWIAFYDMYVRPYLHLYGLFLFVGIPFFTSLIFYCTWKMMRHMGIHEEKEALT